MIITRLRLQNFLIHQDRTFIFDKPVVAITGKNGSGKSTVFQGITTALFKQQERGNLDDLITYGKDRCIIELEFIVGNKYKVIFDKKRGQTPTHLLYKEEALIAETTTATTNAIKEIFSIDYDGFIGSVFCPQDKLNFITGLKPDARKEVLSTFLGISGLLKIGNKALDVRRELNLRVEKVRGAFELSQSQLNAINKQLEMPIDSVQEEIDSLSEELDTISNQIETQKNSVSLAQQLRIIEQSMESTEESIEKLKNELVEVEDFDIGEARKIQNELSLQSKALMEVKSKLVIAQKESYKTAIMAKTQLEAIDYTIKKILSLDKCPTCLRVVTEVDKHAAVISLESNKSTLETSVEKYNSIFEQIQNKLLETETNISNVTTQINALSTLLSKAEVKDSYRNALNQLYESQAKYKEQFFNLQSQIQDFDVNRYNMLIQKIDNTKRLLDLAKTKATGWNINKATAEKLHKEFDSNYLKLKILSDQVVNYKTIENIYSEQGVITYAISKFIRQIESLTNSILKLLSSSLSMSFSITTKNLDIIVRKPDSIMPYELRSGGEKAKVDLALRLALAILVQNTKGRNLRTLFLDEALSAIDVEGRQNFINVLGFLKSYFDRIIVVNHLIDLDCFSDRIEL